MAVIVTPAQRAAALAQLTSSDRTSNIIANALQRASYTDPTSTNDTATDSAATADTLSQTALANASAQTQASKTDTQNYLDIQAQQKQQAEILAAAQKAQAAAQKAQAAASSASVSSGYGLTYPGSTGSSYSFSTKPKNTKLTQFDTANTPGTVGNGSNQPHKWVYQNNLSAARNKALSDAFSYTGDPYRLGGLSHKGIDCSGLVMAVYDQFGFGKYVDSHSSRRQGQAIPGVRTSIKNLKPGDIVAWKDGSHIAVYAGNGMIVAAASPAMGVKYQPVWGSVYGIHIKLPGE